MIKHLLLISSLLVSGFACAETEVEIEQRFASDKWIEYIKGDNTTTYYNFARINPVVGSTSKEIDVWLKIIFTKNTSNYFEVGDYALVQERIRCSDNQSKATRSAMYKKDKKMVFDNPKTEPYKVPLPDSSGELLVTMICSTSSR